LFSLGFFLSELTKPIGLSTSPRLPVCGNVSHGLAFVPFAPSTGTIFFPMTVLPYEGYAPYSVVEISLFVGLAKIIE
jgi:hypothetical protein